MEQLRQPYPLLLLVSIIYQLKWLCFTATSFGAAFTPFYRLVGPYRSPLAPQVIKTEVWDTIARRGIIGNIIMGLIPMIFYLLLSGVAYLLGSLWQLAGGTL